MFCNLVEKRNFVTFRDAFWVRTSIVTHYYCLHMIINSQQVHISINRETHKKKIVCTVMPLFLSAALACCIPDTLVWLYAGAVWFFVNKHGRRIETIWTGFHTWRFGVLRFGPTFTMLSRGISFHLWTLPDPSQALDWLIRAPSQGNTNFQKA